MEPNYGSAVPTVLGEVNDEASAALLEREITEKVNSQEVNVQVTKVQVTKTDMVALVLVEYRVITFDITDTVLLQS